MRNGILCAVAAVSVGLTACNRDSAIPERAAFTSSADSYAAERPVAVRTSGRAEIATTAREIARPPTGAAMRELTIPAGTSLRVVLDDTVGSDISRVEDVVHAHLARPIAVRGETVLPAGSRLTGVVTGATRSAKVKGRAHVAVRFNTVAPRGDDERYTIRTTAVSRVAPGTKKKDAIEIGAPAAGGAIIGGLLGGKKGALIGTAVGAGGGTAVVLSTRGKEIHLPKGTPLTLRLSRSLTVLVRG